MVDPFNVAGLTMASLALPAQLFSDCTFGYSTIMTARNIGHTASTTFWLLKIQETRFLVWGQNCDIYGRGLQPEELSPPVYEMIVATLVQIISLLRNSSELCSRYGLQPAGESEQMEQSRFHREVSRQSTLVFKVQKSCSLFRKMRWAVQDETKFRSLVSELTAFNDSLYQFRPLMRGPSISAVIDAETLARTLVDDGIQGVRRLQQAAQGSGLRMQNLAAMASAVDPGREREASDSIEIPLSTLPSNGAPAADRYAYHTHALPFVPSQQLVLSRGRCRVLQSIPSAIPDCRSWGQLIPNNPFVGGRNRCIVIEWRMYNPMQVDDGLKKALQARIEALVRMLRHEPKPQGFRVLDCLGYFEDPAASKFGIVFQSPRELDGNPTRLPTTLYEAIGLGRSPFFLGSRFRLAKQLAESLYELHSSGWLHKSISSHNVLFFGKESGTALPPPLEEPYFSGFTSSRPDDPSQISSQMVERGVGIYSHPDVQGFTGARRARFRAEYDIYSLGIVLLEIGLWKPFEKQIPDGTLPSDAARTNVTLLGFAVGERYMAAVRKCLDARFDGMQGIERDEGNLDSYSLNLQRSFFWEVVKPLGECQA
jgi:hypothetical protein